MMNRDAEAARQFLAWLLQDPNSTGLTPSGEKTSQATGMYGSEIPDLHVETSNEFTAEKQKAMFTNLSQPTSSPSASEGILSFETGEISAVQDRFHALLKRRLRSEIERNPPLFPWETEVSDYSSEQVDLAIAELVPTGFWMSQIQQRLPVPMSSQILAQVMDQCQHIIQSSLQQGVKLVQAVESLFPGETQTLNYLAGLVLASPSRSPMLTPSSQMAGFPDHYDAATPLQQMALSLLAAREIMDALTLTVSPSQSHVERPWLTDMGAFILRIDYQVHASRLRIEGQLPCQGKVQLQGVNIQSSAQRSTAGLLSVELSDVKPGCLYPLEVQLTDEGHPPLTFVIQVAAQAEQ